MIRVSLATILIALWGAGATLAEPSSVHVLPYTGRLVDDKGVPVQGPVDLALSFYGTETGEAADHLLTPKPLTFPKVNLQNGVFQVSMVLDDADFGRVFGDPSRSVFLEVKDVTHDLAYRRQRFVPQNVPPPVVPRDLVEAAGAACLASPVAGGKLVVVSFDTQATCAATCTAQRQASCVRGWTLFQGDKIFDFGNECASLSSVPGQVVKGKLCCCLSTGGPETLLPPPPPEG